MADKWKIAVMDGQAEGNDGFLLATWKEKEDGNFQVALEQSDPGNLLEAERTLRVLARMLARSGSPLYNLVGNSVLNAIEVSMDTYVELATASPDELT